MCDRHIGMCCGTARTQHTFLPYGATDFSFCSWSLSLSWQKMSSLPDSSLQVHCSHLSLQHNFIGAQQYWPICVLVCFENTLHHTPGLFLLFFLRNRLEAPRTQVPEPVKSWVLTFFWSCLKSKSCTQICCQILDLLLVLRLMQRQTTQQRELLHLAPPDTGHKVIQPQTPMTSQKFHWQLKSWLHPCEMSLLRQ